MSTYVFGAFYAMLFVLLCKMFLEIFEVKRQSENKIVQPMLLAGLRVSVYSITVIFANHFMVKEIFVLVCSTLVMWGYFKQRLLKILVFVLLYQGIGLTIDYAAIILISKCFPVITYASLSEPMVNIFIGALSQAILFCLIMFLKRLFDSKSSEVLTAMEWIRFAVFPIFTIMVIIALMTGFEIPLNSSQKNILICVAFGLIVLNIVVFYLISDILKREVQIRENEILMERVRSETEHYDKQRKREHEYKNQISVIAALASENRVDELNEYLKEYTKTFIGKMDLIDTNNIIVNSILNLKYQEAKEKGITFVVKIGDLSGLKMKDEDIVMILSNILNNAIEASEKCKEPTIKVKFVKERKQIVISVINTLSVEPIVVGDKYITTKMNHSNLHGIGIENVKETVNKYDGTCVIKHDKSTFQFSILITEEGIS